MVAATATASALTVRFPMHRNGWRLWPYAQERRYIIGCPYDTILTARTYLDYRRVAVVSISVAVKISPPTINVVCNKTLNILSRRIASGK
jgi:hypothetical protein